MTKGDPAKKTTRKLPTSRFADGAQHAQQSTLITEVPIALVFDGTTTAVMMATPNDLTDFAFGFALTEGIISTVDDVQSFEVLSHDKGVEARFWLSPLKSSSFRARMRLLTGPVGCGLCGVDSLDTVHRTLPDVTADLSLTEEEILGSAEALRRFQPLMDKTGAAHAAGFYRPGEGIVLTREDVGRHNALDKLIGALNRSNIDAEQGAVVMTSRISVELVQKTAMAGCSMLIAASAPTSLAVETAKKCGISLIGFCRNGSFTRYSP